MGNANVPRKAAGSSRRSPKASPTKKASVPRSLNILKMSSAKYRRGLDSENIVRCASQPIATPNKYDEDDVESIRTDVDIAITGMQIYENGSALHVAIANRLPDSSHAQTLRISSDHLESFVWTTPPVSPSLSVSSSGAPVLPRFDKDRIRYLNRVLNALIYKIC
ncbi:uncharacterized protein L3040_004798 [Drepanopeziza brunnea f. sp. 'multigermtubi']|uniref:uncharacterized protein n=1 Tax=Drepanopeziza brunnea f. sp. 'multigermtubi' TaxID=698441 RepID=UPI00238BF9EF|nr:hypothetical protein L3040_004798 [Drepanopeziza brunnea f. sp. 'multigermtubi']